jgi:outer membrane protein OmpA-like peptidoglycan-associated protein
MVLIAIGLPALAVGLYALGGWYGAPWLVERWLADFAAAAPGRVASIATVRFNPFTLEAEVTGIDISDDQTGTAFSAEELSIEISAQSLRERRPVFALIAVRRPRLRLATFEQLGSIVRAARRNGLAEIRFDRLELGDGEWILGENSESSVELANIDGSLTGFDPVAGSSTQYSFRAVTAAGASIESDGSVAADFEGAEGQLAIVDAELEALPARLNGPVSTIQARGRIALTAGFNATQLLATPGIELSGAGIEFNDVSVTGLSGFSLSSRQASAIGNLILTPAGQRIDASGRLEFPDASFDLTDTRATPGQTFTLTETGVLLTAEPQGAAVSINLSGQLTDAGALMLTARMPADPAAADTVQIRVADLPTTTLSAYSRQTLGRGLAAGRANIDLAYSKNGERVSGELKLVARDLTFAPGAAAADTSLEFAAALLENAEGVIDVDLPFATNARSVRNAVTDALAARIAALAATPFDALEPLADGANETASAVPFSPGDASLSDRALATIAQLAEALSSRPRLGLRVNGAYDADADRTALGRQQIQLHVLLATAGPTTNARAVPVDFSSPRAQDVLDEFAGERLSADRLGEIAALFDCSEGALSSLCQQAYYAAVFDALVDNEEIADSALTRLARFRALSIANALADAGIDSERVEVAVGGRSIDSPFGIGLPVELTVAAAAAR